MPDINPMRGIFQGFDIIGAGLRAEMQKAELISVNLSHLQDVGNKHNEPYRRQVAVFQEVLEEESRYASLEKLPGGKGLARGVEISEIYTDHSTELPWFSDPTHPMADEDGRVLMTNVDMFKEMVDLRAVQRSFQANLVALRAYRDMIQTAVQNIGR